MWVGGGGAVVGALLLHARVDSVRSIARKWRLFRHCPALPPLPAGLPVHSTQPPRRAAPRCRPSGIYQHSFEAAQNARHGFPVYSVNIEANHIQKKVGLLLGRLGDGCWQCVVGGVGGCQH